MVRKIILMPDFHGRMDPLQELVNDIRDAAARRRPGAASFGKELKEAEKMGLGRQPAISNPLPLPIARIKAGEAEASPDCG